eukprot:2082643-Amphidinium_carterae.1
MSAARSLPLLATADPFPSEGPGGLLPSLVLSRARLLSAPLLWCLTPHACGELLRSTPPPAPGGCFSLFCFHPTVGVCFAVSRESETASAHVYAL